MLQKALLSLTILFLLNTNAIVNGINMKKIEDYFSQNKNIIKENNYIDYNLEELEAVCEKFTYKSFVEFVNTDTIVFNTQMGKIYPGDLLVWNNEIYDTHNKNSTNVIAGAIQGTCTFLPSLIYQCLVTIDIKNQGRIQFQGSFKENPDSLAVTGGTDCYQLVKGGELLITPEGTAVDKKTHYDVTLNWY